MLTVCADDWGWIEQDTDRILSCYRRGVIHSASGMVFMHDSERAAILAANSSLDVGLHLNLTEAFTAGNASLSLRERQGKIAAYLLARKANQVLWNPFLGSTFEYVVRAQWHEYERLYGRPPIRLNGHHHMHLCMNILLSELIPKGLQVRRHFTFDRREKGPLNRLYRYAVDRWLASRCQISDYFFSMAPIFTERLEKIVRLSSIATVELMVHPGVLTEYRYLLGDEWSGLLHNGLSFHK